MTYPIRNLPYLAHTLLNRSYEKNITIEAHHLRSKQAESLNRFGIALLLKSARNVLN